MAYEPSQDSGVTVALVNGILEKRKTGRSNCYINTRLYAILTGEAMTEGRP